MSEPVANPQNTVMQTEPAAEPRTFTQEEVNTLCAKEAGKAERAILRQLGLTSRDEIATVLDRLNEAETSAATIQNLTNQRNEWETKYNTTLTELATLKNTNILAKHGVTDPDEQEFYAFKIGKMTTAEKDFETAASEYFEAHPINRASVELSRISNTATRTGGENNDINAAIRAAAGVRL